MRSFADRKTVPYGAAALAVLVALMLASFNLSKIPPFVGDFYRASFSDASGLKPGDMVQVAGVDVGKVEDIQIATDHVVVVYEITEPVSFGPTSSATIEVLNLLGEKYLELHPSGGGQMAEGALIPQSRTEPAYDVVTALGNLTTTTEQIDTGRLSSAFGTLSDTLRGSSDEVRGSLRGLSRLSHTIAGRNAELQTLLDRAHVTARILDSRKGQLTTLMRDARLLLEEIRRRRAVIHRVLVGATELSRQLTGLVHDNQRQLAPALGRLRVVLDMLQRNEEHLEKSIRSLEPYAMILGNIVGSGPWFDNYVVNLASPEFVPGERPGGPGGDTR
jgi:phospholipid/cholesterol/gamma-HCH transport system substrate-binding protein